MIIVINKYGSKISKKGECLEIKSGNETQEICILAWIVYDITVTKRRNKVVKLCKDFGLIRAQKSVFVGLIDEERIQKLENMLAVVINPKCDSVFLLPTTRATIEESLYLGVTFDKKLAMREHELIFF